MNPPEFTPFPGDKTMNEKACDQPQETPRGMGYIFEKPSNKGIIIRAPTPEERQAKDKHIESLREERGAEEALRVALGEKVKIYRSKHRGTLHACIRGRAVEWDKCYRLFCGSDVDTDNYDFGGTFLVSR